MSSAANSPSQHPPPFDKAMLAKEDEDRRLASSPTHPVNNAQDVERDGQASRRGGDVDQEKRGHRVVDAAIEVDVFEVDQGKGAPNFRGVTFMGALALMLKSYVISFPPRAQS
jgi:hypothetical protein